MKPACKIISTVICFAILMICLSPANSHAQNSLPKNLNEAILCLKQNLSKIELYEFKKLPEEKAVAEQHFKTGLWIRNNWIRGGRDAALTKYFNSLDIHSADDMSSIILTSLHRSLNHKNIDVNKQVEGYKAYWTLIIECDKKQKEDAFKTYNKFKVGDEISIYMPVDDSDGDRNVFEYMCPKVEWIFNPQKDLLMKGKIVEKYVINSPQNGFFKVKVGYMNYGNTQVLGKNVKVGDDIDCSLIGLKVK
ncbi:hypothetical protein MTO98_32560 [Mucilaginibacter sp. SMC90]|uniref:DUF6794 domain-containing protein n=1 Tax=Mucilaginibacter sp. SMC90 TaxID=2929803 RepID=UPI001FB537D4|nr:DUF6794 domain-containing protein [Mucilaginibacter sp. SMC90]UOE49130.1 hypothetical protein MTO98_32560 [Mucilaginibacter sp. SMC90]